MKELIFKYWDFCLDKCSEFDFYDLFEQLNIVLERKLALHGQLSFEKYVQYLTEIYGNIEILDQFKYKSKHSAYQFTYENIVNAIFEPRYQHFRELFKDDIHYLELLKIYETSRFSWMSTKTDNIEKIEKIIHAVHHSGLLFPINDWRREYDNQT